VECVTEPGWFTVFVGGSSDDPPVQATVELTGGTQSYPLASRVPTTAATRLID